MTDYTDEIRTAFRRYCTDKEYTPLSGDALGYIRHCLMKAQRNSRLLGEDVNIYHHPMFALMATDGEPTLVAEFLEEVGKKQGPSK